MANVLQIDPSWHPLINGCPPAFATEWGEDQFGIFIAFSLGDVAQRLRWIPAGAFRMGSPDAEPGRFDHEGPQHTVYISRGFWLFETPCTQALWEAVTGKNPSRFKSPDRPVEQVSWNDVQDFLARINTRIPGLDLVLPTEAQWEHACRAGKETAIYTGPIDIKGDNNAPALDLIASYGGNSGVVFDSDDGWDSSSWREMQYPNARSGTHPVGKKRPNARGLFDMIGNVFEWCADGSRDYDADWKVDPVGPVGADRVVRGGSWGSLARYCRSACRSRSHPDYRSLSLGFRPARVQVS
ncbi:formylglycine-generating enzyme family protein [Thiocapsa roseopersicina]|uniref:Formylglycine-generating enzyme, required for sulfatase activity, contains SUMF1/FGE domain n=1 Tax=Thiocapsa roseopersicina TaxID=1058 RepID=A0A1H2VMP2_THIRO|nr:formylglycine-generating enzyme family protein [Thiocapsa roseopersicina]SDW69558.1 Formylglycine-generating enzyme, required for sulfatase activity, contains SUMF1/FGE domain [Thiocapsa roseopersicina]